MRYQEYYCHEYLNKVYYFCLKKTGSEAEAADLSSDISLQIMQALERDVKPERFAAWVWRIARNRYARWVDRKKKRIAMEREEPYSLSTSEHALSDAMVYEQDLQLLRRELALIRSDYRDLLVAYYFRGKKIRALAEEFQLPENTIKTRLYNSRKKLKEGMGMAREFGKLSYDPEHISFEFSVYAAGGGGEPYSLIRRKLPKNILIQTYRNPSTAEELSLELGIALPYMENEIDELLHSTLLSKVGQRYVSNIAILSKEMLTNMYARFLESISSYAKAVKHVIDAKMAYFHKKGTQWAKTNQSVEDQKWSLLSYEYNRIQMKLFISRHGNGGMADFRQLSMNLTPRPNEGIWDLMGKEVGSALEPADFWLGNESVDQGGSTFVFYINWEKFKREDIKVLNREEDAALNNIIAGRWSACEPRLLQQLEEWGYITQVEGGYLPCCLDIDEAVWSCEAEQSAEVAQAYHICDQLFGEYYDYCGHTIQGEVMQNGGINLDFCQQSFIGGLYPMIIKQLLEEGDLHYSDNKMVGVYHLLQS